MIIDTARLRVEYRTSPLVKQPHIAIGAGDGAMMQAYPRVADLPGRRVVVIPFLTPSIASLWVGLVTPIPAELARPLVKSLSCDAVVGERDIDAVIAPPQGGLCTYERAVSLAVQHGPPDQIERSWGDATAPGITSQPLPTDPEWAGEATSPRKPRPLPPRLPKSSGQQSNWKPQPLCVSMCVNRDDYYGRATAGANPENPGWNSLQHRYPVAAAATSSASRSFPGDLPDACTGMPPGPC